MAPKLNKRQQRELDELEALKASQMHDVSSSEEGDEMTHSSPVPLSRTPFAQLMAQDEEESDRESEGEQVAKAGGKSRKPKKRKKKTTTTTAEPPATPSQDPNAPHLSKTAHHHQTIKDASPVTGGSTPTTKSERKAAKKAKAKDKKSGMDELDQALAELSIKYSSGSNPVLMSMSPADSQCLSKLLSVSLTHLDSEAELRKFFGSKVVQATKAASGPSSSASSGPSAGRRAPASGALRSHLTKPKPTWWAARQREGLSIRAYTEEEVREKEERQGWDKLGGEEKWWTVEYSKKYKSMTKAFMRTVMSGDPQGFWDLIRKLPWHADTLLQLSEVYRHREEWVQAVDFVDRALFTYERSFIGAFNFTIGQNRLDFDHVENRPFFLAIHRQITDLQRRGCVRTAFEFARLLYSLDPWTDPHGALLHLDLLALRAPGMNQWLLDVYDVFSSRRKNQPKEKKGTDARMDPSVLPGLAYSRALAMWMVEDARKDKEHKASSEALKEAVLSFPSVVPVLADKMEASIPSAIRAHKDFKIEVDGTYLSLPNALLHMLSHLYAQHAFSIWKEPVHSDWFTSVLTSLTSPLPSSLPSTPQREAFFRLYEQSSNLRYSAYRHILVLESSYRRLFAFIPREVTESRSLACDPLPPPSAVSMYDATFFEGVEDAFSSVTLTRRQRQADQRRLAQLVGDDQLLQQIQEIFDANPQIAARFPGGVLQLAQFVEQMPADVMEDMLVQLHAAGEGLPDEGRMPGNFDDGVEVGGLAGIGGGGEEEGIQMDNEEEESEEEEEEEASPTLIQGLRNMIGRFLGRSGANPQNDDSTSEDEARQVDDLGVD